MRLDSFVEIRSTGRSKRSSTLLVRSPSAFHRRMLSELGSRRVEKPEVEDGWEETKEGVSNRVKGGKVSKRRWREELH